MSDTTVGLLLKILLDKGGKQEVKKGLEDVAKSVEAVSDETDELGDDFKSFTAAFTKNFETVNGKLVNTKTQVAATADELRKFTRVNLEAAKQQEQAAKEAGDAAKQEQREIALLNKTIKDLAQFSKLSEQEVERLSDELFDSGKAAMSAQGELDKLDKQLARTQAKIADLRQFGESLGRISQGLFLAGSSVIGSIFVSANAEAQRVKEAGGVVDETTQHWLTAQERIARSYQRIGRTAETTFLPLLEQVAALAEKGSKFVEQHPDLVKAALNIGAVTATIGAVGLLVSKGIRFVADATMIATNVKYLLASGMFKTSVDKFFAAVAALKVGGGGALAAGGKGLLAKLGIGWAAAGGGGALTVGVVITGVLAAVGVIIVAVLAALTYDLIAKKFGLTRLNQFATVGANTAGNVLGKISTSLGLQSEEEAKRKTDVFTRLVGVMTGAMEGTKPSFSELISNLLGLEEGLDDLSASTEKAKAEMEGMNIIADLERENLEAEKQYADEKARIIRSSAAALTSATNELLKAQSRIKANLGKTLANLSSNLAKEDQKAAMQLREEQARIVRDGEMEIHKIRQDAQEQLVKLEEEHLERVSELTRSRDALGLAKENREFGKQGDEIREEADKAVKERRQQMAIALSDLRRQYQQERAERHAKYKQDVIDAKAQAAEELMQAREAAAERMREIMMHRAQELQELARSYNEERRRRILAAYDQIKDLGNAQNAERIMRQRYYSVILQESETFMKAYSAKLRLSGATGSATFQKKHSGGYTDDGLYMLKRGEYVLSPETTSAAQGLIGSQLSQQAVLMSMARGGRDSFVVNDQRRFDAEVSPGTRRAIEDAAVSRMNELFKYIGSRRHG